MQIVEMVFISIVVPCISLIILGIKLGNFKEIIKKEDISKEIPFEKIGDYCPQKVRQRLEHNEDIKKESIDEVMKACKCLFYTSICYLLVGILYQICTVYLFMHPFYTYSDFGVYKLSYTVTIFIMQEFLFFWLFLTPIFQALGWHIAVRLGNVSWDSSQKTLEKVIDYAYKVLRYFFGMLFTFALLKLYFFIIEKVCLSPQENPFFLNLMLLMLYQYVILKLLIVLLKLLIIGILKFIIRPLKKILLGMRKKIKLLQQLKQWLLQYFEKYSKDEILYLTLKNYTYLSMVLLYTLGLVQYADSPLVMAIGTLFLIDVFLVQDGELQKRINKSE
jgi:hypothetical protein